MKNFSFLFLVLIVFGCHKESTSPTEQINPKLGESFELKIGQSVTIKNEQLRLQFFSVPSDSRCPEGARCIWTGDATVVLKLTDALDSLNTMTQPSELIFGSYNIRLLNLYPYPKIGVSKDSVQYRAQFVVTK